MAAVIPALPRQGTRREGIKTDTERKLPRPIVFWSINEKSAFRRNRVVQTRLNMLMDDIAIQRETSRKSIRYEAHKFRQKNGKFYSHPLGTSADVQARSINIAPPNWKPPNERIAPENTEQMDEYNSDDEVDGNDVIGFSPRERGIITRARKPVVSFSTLQKVHCIENDLQIDDLESKQCENTNCDLRKPSQVDCRNNMVRSISAIQERTAPDVVDGRHSAFPNMLTNTGDTNVDDDNAQDTNASGEMDPDCLPGAEVLRPHSVNIPVVSAKSTSIYFDKGKAAYQLRQELRRRARMRRDGINTSIFTLKDALNLEKETYLKSKDKVSDYVNRIDAEKKMEFQRAIANKWTRKELAEKLKLSL